MLRTVLILSGIFTDVRAAFENKTDAFQHQIHKRGVLGFGRNLCQRMHVKDCKKQYPRLLKDCKICGLTNEQIRHDIIDGEDVNPPYVYPWMVVLMKGRKKTCGGAIISDKFILTAAHCISKTDPGNKKKFMRYRRPREVLIGFLTEGQEVASFISLARIIPHPEFRFETLLNDIALLQLRKSIYCGMLRNPICLPGLSPNFSPDMFKTARLYVTGWGVVATVPRREKAKSLQQAKVRMTSSSVCRRYQSDPDEKTICIMGVEGQRPCFGDSGGSVFGRFGGKYVTLGLASYQTSKVCKVNKPCVYTTVAEYIPWIIQTMAQHTPISLKTEEEDEGIENDGVEYNEKDEYDKKTKHDEETKDNESAEYDEETKDNESAEYEEADDDESAQYDEEADDDEGAEKQAGDE